MFRIDTDTAVAVKPAPDAAGAAGFFTKGSPGPGIPVPATNFSADWCNIVQEEIAGVVLAAGIALDKTQNSQLLAAILAMSGAGRNALADTGSVNAYAVAPAPAITAYANGQKFSFVPAHVNTSGVPTLAVSALAAKTIVHTDGSALQAGDIPIGGVIEVVYSTAIGKFVLLSFIPALQLNSGTTGYFRIPGTPFIVQFTGYSIGVGSAANMPSPVHWGVNAAVSYPISFPNGTLKVWGCPNVDTDGQLATMVAAGNGPSTAQIYAASTTTTGTATGTLFALGY